MKRDYLPWRRPEGRLPEPDGASRRSSRPARPRGRSVPAPAALSISACARTSGGAAARSPRGEVSPLEAADARVARRAVDPALPGHHILAGGLLPDPWLDAHISPRNSLSQRPGCTRRTASTAGTAPLVVEQGQRPDLAGHADVVRHIGLAPHVAADAGVQPERRRSSIGGLACDSSKPHTWSTVSLVVGTSFPGEEVLAPAEAAGAAVGRRRRGTARPWAWDRLPRWAPRSAARWPGSAPPRTAPHWGRPLGPVLGGCSTRPIPALGDARRCRADDPEGEASDGEHGHAPGDHSRHGQTAPAEAAVWTTPPWPAPRDDPR